MLPLELTAQADERTVRSSGLTQSSPLAEGAPSWFDDSYEAMPTKMIQELVGHSTLTMTLRYMHLAPSALTEPIDLLDSGQPVGSALSWSV